MNILIAYMTKYGAAKQCAEILANKLYGTKKIVDINEEPDIDITPYEIVVIGGSIYAGRIQNKVKDFCRENIALLLKKEVGLFICCMEEGEKAEKELKESYPEELFNHAVAKDYFGGAFNFEKMNFIEKFLVKKIAKVESTTSKISEERIAGFSLKFKSNA